MYQQLNQIRFAYIRSHVYALCLTTLTLLSVFLSLHILFSPEWLSSLTIAVVTSLYFIVGLVISIYVGFKLSSNLKDQVDSLSVLITRYANGNYQSRIHFSDDNEISRIGNELNELGLILQNQVASLQRMADEKSAYAKKAYHVATIEERQRLARELHDSVSQQLFALTMMAEASRLQVDQDVALAKQQIDEVIIAGQTAQAEMRALLLHLRPVYLSGDTLEQAIMKLMTELESKCHLSFTLQMEEHLILPKIIEEHIFRIIQEAFSNILRHAEAEQVKVTLKKQSTDLFICISDDGRGFDSKEVAHKKIAYGLKMMRERTEELGGIFSIKTQPGRGTYLEIRIPC